MMKLGGNIVLDGCDNLEPATLIVLKKMVGNYARKISEKNIGTSSNCRASKPMTRAITEFSALLSPKTCIFIKIPKTTAKISKKGRT